MYVHSYQSYVWNQLVSFRFHEYGLVPVPGDLVFESEDMVRRERGSAWSHWSERKYGKEVSLYFSLQLQGSVVALTEDNCHHYTLFDVVMPLPGYSVQYPTNAGKRKREREGGEGRKK